MFEGVEVRDAYAGGGHVIYAMNFPRLALEPETALLGADKVGPGFCPPHAELVGKGFPGLREKYEDTLFDRESGEGRHILYNVGGVDTKGRYGCISLAC